MTYQPPLRRVSPSRWPVSAGARKRRIRAFSAIGLLVSGAAVMVTAIALLLPSTSPSDGAGTGPVTVGVEDGFIADGESISPFADELAAIANLDSGLRDAMQAAARDAQADGFDFVITSGWRSDAYQDYIFDRAVAQKGADAAGELVAAPGTSSHESGNAVDIGYTDANSWMQQHGSDYGLCQRYTNEMWHFELLTTPGGECPEQLTDARSDGVVG